MPSCLVICADILSNSKWSTPWITPLYNQQYCHYTHQHFNVNFGIYFSPVWNGCWQLFGCYKNFVWKNSKKLGCRLIALTPRLMRLKFLITINRGFFGVVSFGCICVWLIWKVGRWRRSRDCCDGSVSLRPCVTSCGVSRMCVRRTPLTVCLLTYLVYKCIAMQRVIRSAVNNGMLV